MFSALLLICVYIYIKNSVFTSRPAAPFHSNSANTKQLVLREKVVSQLAATANGCLRELGYAERLNQCQAQEHALAFWQNSHAKLKKIVDAHEALLALPEQEIRRQNSQLYSEVELLKARIMVLDAELQTEKAKNNRMVVQRPRPDNIDPNVQLQNNAQAPPMTSPVYMNYNAMPQPSSNGSYQSANVPFRPVMNHRPAISQPVSLKLQILLE